MNRLGSLLVFALLLAGCRDDESNVAPDSGPGETSDAKTTAGDGGAQSTTAITEINSGAVAEGAEVVLAEVVITAVDRYGEYSGDIFVQEVAPAEPFAGLQLYRPQRIDGGELDQLKVGDVVKVEGAVDYFAPKDGFKDKDDPQRHVKQISDAKLTYLRSGEPVAPVPVTVADLGDRKLARSWEGMLVRVENVVVTKAMDPRYNEFGVGGSLAVGSDLHLQPVELDQCLSITGVLKYFYFHKLHPRTVEDVEQSQSCAKPIDLKISDLQDGTSPAHPALKQRVSVEGVVTAVDGTKGGTNQRFYGFWIQDGSGPHSGIYVFHSWDEASAIKPVLGESVRVTGTYDEFHDSSQLTDIAMVSLGQAELPAAELFSDPAEIATGGAKSESFEGVFVEVQDVEVGELTKDSKQKVLGFKLTGSGLLVEADLVDFVSTPPAVGTKYKTVRGVLHYSFDNFKILPRTLEDLQPAE